MSSRIAADSAPGLSPRVRGKRTNGRSGSVVRRSIPACAGEAACGRCRRLTIGVYPRVCGGSVLAAVHRLFLDGLSPRVRGKQGDADAFLADGGSIPACAGEASATAFSPAYTSVYPRVCGGSDAERAVCRCGRGLSPRVRGKLNIDGQRQGERRSIPACAGEARPYSCSMNRRSVYPRVCGGSVFQYLFRIAAPGLSPRVRGKRRTAYPAARFRGSIPACAGEAV